MRMDDMVSHLESMGFKVTKKYITQYKHYQFEIEKNGNHMLTTFEYPADDAPVIRNEKQEAFLDGLVRAFEKEFEHKDAFDGVLDRLRLYARPRGFSVHVNKSSHIVFKQGRQRSWSFTHDDPEITTFVKLKERVDWLMDQVDEAFEKAEIRDYVTNDIKQTKGLIDMLRFRIKNVIFNDPATIVLWTDGTKTVVKFENETFDPEKGLAMAISKKALGNKGNYYNTFTKWLPKEEDDSDFLNWLKIMGDVFGAKTGEKEGK